MDKAGAGYLDIYAAVNGTTTQSANTGLLLSQLLFSGSQPVAWNSVNWNSVNWNSVNWNSVNWNSVNWNSQIGLTNIWDESVVSAASAPDREHYLFPPQNTDESEEENISNRTFLPLLSR